MNQTELEELAQKFQSALENRNLEKFLQETPKSVLILRLSLCLSQRQFIRRLRSRISQVMLIRHERGLTKKLRKETVNELLKIIPRKINIKTVLSNHRKFQEMKQGYHMTPERAKKLHKIWQQKTTKKQRQEWGRLGAIKANTQQRLTNQEQKVKEILDSSNLKYEIHKQVNTKITTINIDFVVYRDNIPYFIEVTKRKHDIPILCQAYAYRSRILKEKYPNSKVVILIDNIPLYINNILNQEFDFVLNSNSINKLSKFLLSPIQHT